MSHNPLPPINSESTTGFFRFHIHKRCIWNPKEAMVMSTTLHLPLVTILMIFIIQQRTDHIFHESLSLNSQVMGDEMRLVLYPIPDEPMPYGLTSLRYLRLARKVSVKVPPLHVGTAKGYENRRHVL